MVWQYERLILYRRKDNSADDANFFIASQNKIINHKAKTKL